MKILFSITALLTILHSYIVWQMSSSGDGSGGMFLMLTLPINYILILVTIISFSVKKFKQKEKEENLSLGNSHSWTHSPYLGLGLSYLPVLHYIFILLTDSRSSELLAFESLLTYALPLELVLVSCLNLFVWVVLNPKYRLFVFVPIVLIETMYSIPYLARFFAFLFGH